MEISSARKNEKISHREKKFFDVYYKRIAVKTDRMFAGLFLFQWILGVIFAVWITPTTWIGEASKIHIHVFVAIFLGGLTAALPIYAVLRQPGSYPNRYIVATAQILFSILFIHLTGGRIETHFHVFGSLAFLAFYRDFRPLLFATALTALDHVLRGIFWPQSVYGVLTASPFRALEHAAWVIFEDIFLLISMQSGIKELWAIAKRQVSSEMALASVEQTVAKRTAELMASQKIVTDQQQALAVSTKMSALGEMAGGIAHEINNPLGVISLRSRHIQQVLAMSPPKLDKAAEFAKIIESTAERASLIIKGLRAFSRDGRKDPFEISPLKDIVDNTLVLCVERFKLHGITFTVEDIFAGAFINGRSVQISQVLLNIFSNAHDAVFHLPEKWIKVSFEDLGENIKICVKDSGKGIPANVRDKIMQPFFTTKEVGKGTGLGLSVSNGIIEDHGGTLTIDDSCPHTCFVIILPKAKPGTQSPRAA